jgi:hypothetical protein
MGLDYSRSSPRALVRCLDKSECGCDWVEDPNDLLFAAEIVSEDDPRCTWPTLENPR